MTDAKADGDVNRPAYVYDLLAEPRAFAEVDRLQLDLAAARSQGAVPDTIVLLRAPAHAHARPRVRRRAPSFRAASAAYRDARLGGRCAPTAAAARRGTARASSSCYPILDLRDHGKDLRALRARPRAGR